MIGDNLPHHIQCADDARAFANAIAALRAEAECIEATYRPHLDVLKAEADAYRAERDDKLTPYKAQMTALREVLADWLAGDPDGNLRDGERIVATLIRRKPYPVIDPEKVPDRFKSLAVDMAKINAALVHDETIPGVTWKTDTILKVP